MPRSSDGTIRYPKTDALTPRAASHDLGVPMSPADVFIALRQIAELEDDEMLQAFAAGADRIEAGDAPPALLAALGGIPHVVAQARAVTPSRLVAWRRRGREMTWPELRVLLLGLRDVILGPKEP